MKGQAGDRVAFDFTLEEIEWELNEENIEEYSEDIDDYGVIVIRAFDEDGDFVTRIIADVDIADGLYDAMSEVEDIIDEYPEVKVYYTTRCKVYGVGKTWEHGEDIGCVLSSFLGADDYSDYDCELPAICRITWKNTVDVWTTDDCGCYEGDSDESVFASYDLK